MTKLTPKSKRKIIIAAAVTLVLAVIVGACAIYLGDYYKADIEAIGAFLPQGSGWEEQPDGTIVFERDDAAKGFIFYPGGKVEYTAYIPLMQALSEYGVTCVLVEMPFNLAVLDINAADGIQKDYPEIEDWYIGGHSLGGSMAASYLASHTDDFAGLVLLGAYSTADLSASNLDVLSVYGSEDKVMNREKYVNNKTNLPEDFTEVVLDGGCHASFGMYGAQDGDGTPGISNEEQIALTADAIIEMMMNKEQTN
ncbi:MAG: alpha/beta hydrolase [Ruminococcaceae bacterium]|nr:alpha/beta hydrolase [Oscillospiraceae bacterium]